MEVVGLKELEKVMRDELPATVSRQKTLQALRAASKPMVQTAKNNVPKGGSGALAESIGIKTVPKGRTNTFASMTVSPLSGNMTAWALWMKHYNRTINLIDRRTGKVDAGGIGRIRHGHLVEFGFRHTSGKHVPARPFMRKAFDEKADSFVNDFASKLRTRIENEVTKRKLVGPRIPRSVLRGRSG